MFYVFNKSKIYSYMIAVCTVVVLFIAASSLNDIISPSNNVVPTGANVVEVNEIKNLVINE